MATIDKATAAERLVVCAIIMAERGEDPLAIHVIAASALQVLRDLIKKAGDDYVEQVLKIGAFTVASARVNGESVNLPSNAEMDAVVDTAVNGIKAGTVTQAADLVINLNAAGRRALLDSIVKPYNFLKHADNDPLATLDETDIDPDHVIGHALSALTMVSPGKPLPDTIKPYLERRDLLAPEQSSEAQA
ncbi:hypothetical protein [Sphingopyxis witflariensis]|mgnify:CR=1 FL=1|nr:hypothetical protein [Sphingopyxis witflariensis]